MNCTIYLYGDLGSGYTQYPNDFTKSYFQEFERSVKSKTAICVRREGDMMYYQYINRISDNHYIGIVSCFNGVILTDIAAMVDLYEKSVTDLVINGEILEFTNDGNITPKVGKIHEASSEFKRMSDSIFSQINSNFLNKFEKISVTNYSINKDTIKEYSIKDDLSIVVNAIRNYSKVYIYTKDDDSKYLNSYAGKLKQLSGELRDYKKQIEIKDEKITKLKRQKQQTTVVLILVEIMIVGGLLFLATLQDRNSMISSQKSKMYSLSGYVSELQEDSINLSEQLMEKNNECDRLRGEVRNLNDRIEDLQTQINKYQNASTPNAYSSGTTSQHSGTTSQKSLGSIYPKDRKYSEYQQYVGAYISSIDNPSYDSTYAMCVYATKPLKINSFYVKANNTGAVTLGLYDSQWHLVASKMVFVRAFKEEKVNVNFELSANNNYYLAIVQSQNGNISLQYHSSTSAEYSNYQTRCFLKIIGSLKKGRGNIPLPQYYQYFYNISYSLEL